MKNFRITIAITFILAGFQPFAQNFEELEFGTDSTLDVVTWNLEHFPKLGTITTGYVSEIIQALEADVVAIQEIEDHSAFYSMVAGMENYACFAANLDYTDDLAYIYNTETVEMISIDSIFIGERRPFPRNPLVLEMMFMDQKYYIINNHYKAGGDGILILSDSTDPETRRYDACYLLDEYIATELPDENVIVLGDLNDVLTDGYSNNVFRAFLEQPDTYLFTDMAIAEGSWNYWSYPTWPSHIDHILITNELFDEFENESTEITTLLIDDYFWGWDDYDFNVSDHRPVGLKLMPGITTGEVAKPANPDGFTIAPNPCNKSTQITLPPFGGQATLIIVDANGRKKETIIIEEGEKTLHLQTSTFPPGIYSLLLVSERGITNTQKIMVTH